MHPGHRGATRPTPYGGGLLTGVVLAVLGVVTGLATLASVHGYAVVHRCVDIGATGAAWGMRLALVRDSAACPAGEVAVGGTTDAAVHVVGALAVSVLVAHVAALCVAVGAGAAVARAVTRFRTAARRRLVALVRTAGAVPADDRADVPVLGRRSAAVARAVHGAAVTWRGPPALSVP
ncbi:hypothetical protein [Paraoerskovia marina]|uniref:hypothetical protein n=1 Tax=Paraoerskovia marina TaxID=545619 RepID=UPI00049266C9|nr:hypothetical protein [Paraoerskovia marina]